MVKIRRRAAALAVLVGSCAMMIHYHFKIQWTNVLSVETTTTTFTVGLPRTTNNNNIIINNQQKKKPRAIVHVGPFKTGSTTIQQSIYQVDADLLQRHNVYGVKIKGFLLQHAPVGSDNWKQRRQYVQQVLNQTQFLQSMARHAQQRHNVLVSSEHLGGIPRKHTLVWKLLHQALEPFDTTIVVTYRRFAEWWYSYYKATVPEMIHKEIAAATTRTPLPSFASWVEHQLDKAQQRQQQQQQRQAQQQQRQQALPQSSNHRRDFDPNQPFVAGVGDDMIATHPARNQRDRCLDMGFTNITIFNFHSHPQKTGAAVRTTTTDLATNFYCHVLGEDSGVCHDMHAKRRHPALAGNDNSATANSSGGTMILHANKGKSSFEYDRLAHAFLLRVRYSSYTSSENEKAPQSPKQPQSTQQQQQQRLRLFKDLRRAIQHRPNGTALLDSLQKECMPPSVASRLLNLSLAMERDLMSAGYVDSLQEAQHIQQFQEQAPFCSVNVQRVVNNVEWQTYLTSKLATTQRGYQNLEFF